MHFSILAGVFGTALAFVSAAFGQPVPALATVPAGGAADTVSVAAGVANTFTYRVSWDAALLGKSYTGRVYIVMTSARGAKNEPRMMVNNWFQPPMVLSRDVAGVAAGTEVELKAGADGVLQFPADMAKFETRFGKLSKVRVQAVARVSRVGPVPGQSEGDVYSEPVDVTVSEGGNVISGGAVNAESKAVVLKLSRTVGAAKFQESAKIKEFTMVSPELSAFHGFEYTVKAGVSLPEGWSEEAVAAGKTWPVVYSVTGFGSEHVSVKDMGRKFAPGCILVVPDASNHDGHSVFADSVNTGPWGQVLTLEIAPAIEKKFGGPLAAAPAGALQDRLRASASRRFTTGVSSGGWSSLWLVVTYPAWFDSCWSHVPDPVDFRDFQQIDLTEADVNMLRTQSGVRRPIARMGDNIALYYDDFVSLETAIGPGGQIHSFEAVFSPKGADGKPRQVFERATGKVNPEVAKAWEKYDIRVILERDWADLGPKLTGKLHVFAGDVDNFYLDGAARLLKASLAKLGSDAVVEIVPDMGHRLYGKGQEMMLARIKQRQDEFEKGK